MFNGKIHYKWPFSIAMLVHQRIIVRITSPTVGIQESDGIRFLYQIPQSPAKNPHTIHLSSSRVKESSVGGRDEL